MILLSSLGFDVSHCFARNKVYSGQHFAVKKLQNAEECQQLCQESKGCEMFIFATNQFYGEFYQRSSCYLMKDMAESLSTVVGVIAGPKFCHNNGGNFSKLNSI